MATPSEAGREPMGLTPEVLAAFARQIGLAFWRQEPIEPIVERIAHAAALAERAAVDDEWIDRANRYFDGIEPDPRARLRKAWGEGSVVADVVMHEVWKRRIREAQEVAAIRSREQAEARREEER
jgi:hypothetical protein